MAILTLALYSHWEQHAQVSHMAWPLLPLGIAAKERTPTQQEVDNAPDIATIAYTIVRKNAEQQKCTSIIDFSQYLDYRS